MNRLKLIVGLLNPGKKYVFTRHNVGAWYLSSLIKKYNLFLKNNSKFFGLTSKLDIDHNILYLLMPDTFMNLSGTAVNTMSKFYNIKPEEILIVHDELNLPPGIAKFKQGGSHGGHNGLKDIINKFGNNKNFYRLRIGIGHPGDSDQVERFVLSEPSVDEKKLINKAIVEALFCTEIWLKNNYTKAVNCLNSLNK
ncbi:aminoacyl-tRNA hydrolase [Candidatus Pantoea edessiphila]|uniref:Peptidyl-tRNA hydrolase n=1 Tax=Candidatus Pantoea edessiphila TaxID=2044610 RepID=A0A2P5T2I1_9GAMM|nr:aminoacyl-tRNA hydrolase [Candidatus Pantoea edessiphila]PPI88787.1 aminoacyl-tRNA hydrolase [Candidatus Pantoea edessiphila]